jgi:hypothetical protein
MTMKNDQEQTTEIEALYIEELGEVRGGIERQDFLTMGIAGAEGVDIRPWTPPGTPREPREPREPRVPYTTLVLGEEGPSWRI